MYVYTYIKCNTYICMSATKSKRERLEAYKAAYKCGMMASANQICMCVCKNL